MTDVQQARGLWRFVWRHRLAGHTIHKGFGLLTPATAYLCEECDLKWTRYHL